VVGRKLDQILYLIAALLHRMQPIALLPCRSISVHEFSMQLPAYGITLALVEVIFYSCCYIGLFFPSGKFSTSLSRFRTTLPHNAVCSEITVLYRVFMFSRKIFVRTNPNFRRFQDPKSTL